MRVDLPEPDQTPDRARGACTGVLLAIWLGLRLASVLMVCQARADATACGITLAWDLGQLGPEHGQGGRSEAEHSVTCGRRNGPGRWPAGCCRTGKASWPQGPAGSQQLSRRAQSQKFRCTGRARRTCPHSRGVLQTPAPGAWEQGPSPKATSKPQR